MMKKVLLTLSSFSYVNILVKTLKASGVTKVLETKQEKNLTQWFKN